MKITIIHALLAYALTCYQNVNIFIGKDPQTSQGYMISAYPDLLLNTTIISPRDFLCNESYECTFDPQAKTMSYMGYQLKYFEAYAQLNVIRQPFPVKYNFRYLIHDEYNLGSIIGLHRNSTYLDYLYKQDKDMGWAIIFRLEWNNTLSYKQGIYETDKLHVYYWLNANVTITQNKTSTTKLMKVCVNNRLDRKSDHLNIMGVKETEYKYWTETLLSESSTQAPNNKTDEVYLEFYTPQGFNIGHMDFKFYEFQKPDGTLRLKSFSPDFDEGRGCDLYSGALMLKKYNFKFYYIEYEDGYEVKFAYDNFSGGIPAPSRDFSSILWKILLAVVVLVVIGFVYYRFVYARQPQLEIAHYGRIEGQAPLEMQEHQR